MKETAFVPLIDILREGSVWKRRRRGVKKWVAGGIPGGVGEVTANENGEGETNDFQPDYGVID